MSRSIFSVSFLVLLAVTKGDGFWAGMASMVAIKRDLPVAGRCRGGAVNCRKVASSALSSTGPPTIPSKDVSRGGLLVAGFTLGNACNIVTGTELALFRGGGTADDWLAGKKSLFLFLAPAAAARLSDSPRASRDGAGGMATAIDCGTEAVK